MGGLQGFKNRKGVGIKVVEVNFSFHSMSQSLGTSRSQKHSQSGVHTFTDAGLPKALRTSASGMPMSEPLGTGPSSQCSWPSSTAPTKRSCSTSGWTLDGIGPNVSSKSSAQSKPGTEPPKDGKPFKERKFARR